MLVRIWLGLERSEPSKCILDRPPFFDGIVRVESKLLDAHANRGACDSDQSRQAGTVGFDDGSLIVLLPALSRTHISPSMAKANMS